MIFCMRTVVLLLLLLAGCAERWERPGATEQESEAAQAECSAIAARLVPPELVLMQTSPGYWEGPERQCFTRNGRVECVVRPGRYHPPRYDWVDVNAGRRREARAACLTERGWTYEGLRPLRLW